MRVVCRVECLSSCCTPRWQDRRMEAGSRVTTRRLPTDLPFARTCSMRLGDPTSAPLCGLDYPVVLLHQHRHLLCHILGPLGRRV